MGLSAHGQGNVCFRYSFFWPLIALLVILEANTSLAGLSGLNILPHEQLHKGRGISEDVVPHKINLRMDKIKEPTITGLGELAGALLPARSKRLDIVLSHFHPSRVQPALDFWLPFLGSEKVQKMKPYVWLYCQNDNETVTNELTPLLKYGGEVVHLENVGRESHAFLQHITAHYGDLADFTIFSQDIPEPILVDRFEKMFDANATGFLPLSLVAHVPCKDEWLPPGEISQIYAMLTNAFCPPEGYTAAYQGQFLVSKARILGQNWWIYRNLLEMLAAPLDHWVHDMHDNEFYKDRSNPFFGHILERSWSLAFNCYESWRHGNCAWCDHDMHMENCGTDACQCLDKQ